jgi:sugar-specific transcriptional regulator TrmB
VLRSLHSKGLVSHVLSKPMKYQALPPDVAFSNRLMQLRKELERKEREAEQLKEEIERSLRKRLKGREFKVVFLEDPKSIISSMVTDAASAEGEILTAISRAPVTYDWKGYLAEYKRALDRGVKFKFLVHSTNDFVRKALKAEGIREYLERGQIEVRDTYIIHQPFSVIDERITYIFLTDPLRKEFLLAIRIEDETFAKHMKAIFELLWKQGGRKV